MQITLAVWQLQKLEIRDLHFSITRVPTTQTEIKLRRQKDRVSNCAELKWDLRKNSWIGNLQILWTWEIFYPLKTRLICYCFIIVLVNNNNNNNNNNNVHEGLGVFPLPLSSRCSWSLHLFLGRPTLLRPFGLHCSACFGSLFVSTLCTCCSHFFWYCFISFTMFCAPVFSLKQWSFSLWLIIISKIFKLKSKLFPFQARLWPRRLVEV